MACWRSPRFIGGVGEGIYFFLTWERGPRVSTRGARGGKVLTWQLSHIGWPIVSARRLWCQRGDVFLPHLAPSLLIPQHSAPRYGACTTIERMNIQAQHCSIINRLIIERILVQVKAPRTLTCLL
jgi:hypothetical protein